MRQTFADWLAGRQTTPWCRRCRREVPLSEVHPLGGGVKYIHMLPKKVSDIGFRVPQKRCGRIEWRADRKNPRPPE